MTGRADPIALYEIREAGNSGLGVFATGPIARGALFLEEAPLITLGEDATFSTTLADILALGPEERAKFDSLYFISELTPDISQKRLDVWKDLCSSGYGDVEKALILRASTNGLGVPGGGVVADHISRFNHSCLPSASWDMNDATGRIEVRATRNIAPGEQITISYCDLMSTTPDRQEQLFSNWCFHCHCPRCLQDETSEADDVASRLARLEIQPDLIDKGDPATVLVMKPISIADLEGICRSMYRQQLFIPALALFLTQLSILGLESADISKIVGSAGSAHRVMSICYGPDSEKALIAQLWLEFASQHPAQALESIKMGWSQEDWERVAPFMRP